MTTNTEDEAKATLKADIAQIKESTWTLLSFTVGEDFVPKHAGYKSVEEACVAIIRQAKAEIERKVRAFERKWP